MPSRPRPDTPLPRNWTAFVRSAVLHAIALASMDLTVARSQTAAEPGQRRRQQAELDQANNEIAIAQILARAGLHLSATTVGWILKETEPVSEESVVALDTAKPRRVKARRPGDFWHVDLTTVPTSAGFWVPWLPFAVPQSWPFC